MTQSLLSRDKMLTIYREHAKAEFAQDLDKTMSSVSSDPVFEWPALNLRLTGRAAVREMYSRILSRAIHAHVLSQRAFASGDNLLIAEYVLSINGADSKVTRIGLVALIGFEGDKIKFERTYTHPTYTALLRAALGEDFDAYPGVSQIEYESVLKACVPPTWETADTAKPTPRALA
jgi:ketosteroid isomerase-like protein